LPRSSVEQSSQRVERMEKTVTDPLDLFVRWKSSEIRLIGGLLVIIAMLFILPAIYALFKNEDASIFLLPIIPLIAIGSALFLLFGWNTHLRTVNGMVMVMLVWGVMFVEGSIPYLLAGMSPMNAIFESVNGFTTTGASTVTDVTFWPDSLLIWRSLTQWIGGIAFVIIFIYILPMFGMGRSFFKNELEGSGSTSFTMKLKNAAKSFILVYFALTVLNFILLILVADSFDDALCLSLTTISTGGLLISNDSLMSTNTAVQIITMVFMLIGGTNFYLHYKGIFGKSPLSYLKNREFLIMLLYFFVFSIIIYLLLIISAGGTTQYLGREDPLEMYKNTLFMVISFGTTTGSTVYDFSNPPTLVMMSFIILMMIGAAAGSTSGGIKFSRVRIVLRFFSNTLKNVLHPNAVYSIKVDGDNIDDSRVMGAVSITLLYILTVFIGMIVLMLTDLDWVDSLSLAVGAVTNTGVGFGNFGPFSPYDTLSDGVKVFLMILMWMGRLEITLALVFFTPTFWKDVKMTYRTRFTYREKRFRR